MSTADRVSHVVAQLEEEILSGKRAPGDLLPPERELSIALGVSRSVVREALARLAIIGLVERRVGSGTRVALLGSGSVTAGYERLLRTSAFDLEDLMVVRLPLETTMAGLAAERRSDEHLARLEQMQQILGDRQQSIEAHVQADLEFHVVLAQATGNAIFEMVLRPIEQLLIESRRRTLGRDGAEAAFQEHEKILHAVRRKDAAAAEEAMREHLTKMVPASKAGQ